MSLESTATINLGEPSALGEICERFGEHLWCCIGDKTQCGVCGAVEIDGHAFAAVFHMYDLYLRGLVEDERRPHTERGAGGEG